MFSRWSDWCFLLDENGHRKWVKLEPGMIYRIYAMMPPKSGLMIVDKHEDPLVRLGNYSEVELDIYDDFTAPDREIGVMVYGDYPTYEFKIIGVSK